MVNGKTINRSLKTFGKYCLQEENNSYRRVKLAGEGQKVKRNTPPFLETIQCKMQARCRKAEGLSFSSQEHLSYTNFFSASIRMMDGPECAGKEHNSWSQSSSSSIRYGGGSAEAWACMPASSWHLLMITGLKVQDNAEALAVLTFS